MQGFTQNPELLFCQPHKKVTKKSLHDGRLRPLRQVPTQSSITNPPQPTPIVDILLQACKVQEYEQELILVL